MALLAVGLVALGEVAGGVAFRLSRPLPAATLTLVTPSSATIAPGLPPEIPVPPAGRFAIAAASDGILAGRDAEVIQPIASLTKVMTALVVLAAHPLGTDANGPVRTVTAEDVSTVHTVISEGGTYLPVSVGEQLTERQLLLGMMLPSANNFAVMLGRWVGGGDSAFVARLNDKAASLRMTRTHFADPDGLSDQTVSTADDLVKLGEAAASNPTLMSITTQTSATLPGNTTITNLDTLVGTAPGWLGLKTGYTAEAGYCLLFAARRTLAPGSPAVTVVGAVLGQATRPTALAGAHVGVDAAFGGYTIVHLTRQLSGVSGAVSTQWGARSPVGLAMPVPTDLVLRKGQSIHLTVADRVPLEPMPAPATEVAILRANLGGRPVAAWAVITSIGVGPPSLSWRLTHQ